MVCVVIGQLDMNRSSSKLKPLAMKLEAPQLGGGFHGSKCQQSALESKNKNAFAGSHLGVPAGPLENVTSMDPRDYVWGVPQTQPGLYSTGALPHGFYAPSQAVPPAAHHSHVQYTSHAAASTGTGVPTSLGGAPRPQHTASCCGQACPCPARKHHAEESSGTRAVAVLATPAIGLALVVVAPLHTDILRC